jgi:Ca2+-binding RTX toxin-like protein
LLEGEDPYGQYPAVPSNAVEPFSRSASVWFHFDSTQPTALKPGGDADGDGIPDGSEPAGDFDGDGLDEPWDSDSDNDDVPDSLDPNPFDPDVPHPGGIRCTVDNVPPVIVAPNATLTRCVTAPAEELLTVSATDDSCSVRTKLSSFTGNVISVNGRAVTPPLPVDPSDPRVVLPVGTTVIQWRAVDVNNVPATRLQTITVTANTELTSCCTAAQTLVQGNGFPNTIFRLDGRPYCIFGRAGGDTIVTDEGADYLSGGTGSDSVSSSGPGNAIIGGDGNDELEMFESGSGTVYGGAGNDIVHDSGGGTIYGNAGDDFIETDFVAHEIIPGPGRDAVFGGIGNDTVVIYNVCEAVAFETLNGGFGNDTLITPVSVATLLSRGVSLSGFENVIVTTENRHLSECL